mmetsp:Transcript_40357/g.91426  ORF Transcript_40357/g.91426 Transcript_40357/m.91426 type:complete len:295 (+) Transcript_40357:696-1580(+)
MWLGLEQARDGVRIELRRLEASCVLRQVLDCIFQIILTALPHPGRGWESKHLVDALRSLGRRWFVHIKEVGPVNLGWVKAILEETHLAPRSDDVGAVDPCKPNALQVEISAATENLHELRQPNIRLLTVPGFVLLLVFVASLVVRAVESLIDLIPHLQEVRRVGLLKPKSEPQLVGRALLVLADHLPVRALLQNVRIKARYVVVQRDHDWELDWRRTALDLQLVSRFYLLTKTSQQLEKALARLHSLCCRAHQAVCAAALKQQYLIVEFQRRPVWHVERVSERGYELLTCYIEV